MVLRLGLDLGLGLVKVRVRRWLRFTAGECIIIDIFKDRSTSLFNPSYEHLR